MEDAAEDDYWGVAAGVIEAFGKVGKVGAVGVGESQFALESSDDVVGEGFALQNRDIGIGDQEEAGISV